MKMALIQQKASLDRELNRKQGLQAARTAAESGAEVICFAELAFDPFYPQKPAIADVLQLAEPVPGPTTEAFSALAKAYGVVIILNVFERDGTQTFDSSPVIGPTGEIMGVTRMLHITEYEGFHEQGYYHPGDHDAPVYRTPFGTIGIAICYDRHYPEYMRHLAHLGAEVVFIPQAGAEGEWPEGLYEAEMRVTAFQNGYFTALCNRVGKEEVLTFSGSSFVCDPAGRVIARAADGNDDILYCDLDLTQTQTSHAKRLFFRDSRPELYQKWFQ